MYQQSFAKKGHHGQSKLICRLRVCPGLLLSIMDSSVLAASLYRIGVEFQGHSLINWVVLAYTLGSIGFIVSSTALSDVIGQRYALLFSYSLFLTFSAACGFAQDVDQLILFRAFQGVGGSGLWTQWFSSWKREAGR